MSSPRDMVINIPLVYNGLGQKYICEDVLPGNLKVTIRDNGEQLRKIKRAQLHLDYDIASFVNEKQGVMSISGELIRAKLQDQLPGTSKIQAIWPEQIESTCYEQAQKRVRVEVATDISLAAQHQMVGSIKVVPDSVEVYGNSAAIAQIENLKTQVIRAEEHRESIYKDVALVVPAGMEVSEKSVKVTIPIEQFTEKTLSKPISVVGAPEGVQVRLFPPTAHVVARVGITKFAEINADDVEVYCEYPEQTTDALEVKVKSNNINISNIRVSPVKVEYLINE